MEKKNEKQEETLRLGYIYIIDLGDNIYKIGKSINPEKRLLSFSNTNPKMTIYKTRGFENYSAVESFLHKFFKPKNHRWKGGSVECFNFNLDDLCVIDYLFSPGILEKYIIEYNTTKYKNEIMFLIRQEIDNIMLASNIVLGNLNKRYLKSDVERCKFINLDKIEFLCDRKDKTIIDKKITKILKKNDLASMEIKKVIKDILGTKLVSADTIVNIVCEVESERLKK